MADVVIAQDHLKRFDFMAPGTRVITALQCITITYKGKKKQ